VLNFMAVFEPTYAIVDGSGADVFSAGYFENLKIALGV